MTTSVIQLIIRDDGTVPAATTAPATASTPPCYTPPMLRRMTRQSQRRYLQSADFARFIQSAAASEQPTGGVELAMLPPKVRARHGATEPVLLLPATVAKHIWLGHGPNSSRAQWEWVDMSDWLEIQRMLDTLEPWPQPRRGPHRWLYLLAPFKDSVITDMRGRQQRGRRVGLALVTDRDRTNPRRLRPVTFHRVDDADVRRLRERRAAGAL